MHPDFLSPKIRTLSQPAPFTARAVVISLCSSSGCVSPVLHISGIGEIAARYKAVLLDQVSVYAKAGRGLRVGYFLPVNMRSLCLRLSSSISAAGMGQQWLRLC